MNTSIKRERQRTILGLVGSGFTGSQEELASALRERGFGVTQATISRDVSELGLVRFGRGERSGYLLPEDLPGSRSIARRGDDERLRRILADIPVRIGRSGLTLLVIGSAGTANVLAQAIDESTLDEQEGTVAGDNTVLVLFATEGALGRWLDRLQALGAQVSLTPALARGRLRVESERDEGSAPIAASPGAGASPGSAASPGAPASPGAAPRNPTTTRRTLVTEAQR